MTRRRTVVVVGAGAAGVSVAATLRAEGHDGRVVLVGDEAEAPYRRPALSKEVLRGERGPDDVRLKPAAWYHDHDVELLLGARVGDIDPGRRTVELDGATLGYDEVVLATGGTARALPPALGSGGPLKLRSMADVPALQDALQPGRSVVVVGAGLVGCELAASARARGCEVTVVEAAPLPLGRLLPPEVARAVADLHRDRGVALRLGSGVASVARSGDGVAVRTDDGGVVAADVLVVGVGMAPRTGLAARSGVPVGTGAADGVLVDYRGATGVPGVWAAGDVACFPDPLTGRHRRLEHWQSAQSGGTVVARAILGQDVRLDEVPWCWSDQHGVNLQVCGSPAAGDDVVVRGDLAVLDGTTVHARDGRLTGAVTLGRPREMRLLRALVARAPHTPLSAVGDPDADLAALAAAGAT